MARPLPDFTEAEPSDYEPGAVLEVVQEETAAYVEMQRQ